MKKISRCLNPKLADICRRTIQLSALNELVRQHLPETLKNQCWVGSFNEGTLLLCLDNPVWASELRYFLPELRDALRTTGGLYQLRAIKLSLNTISTNAILVEKKPKATPLSLKAEEALKKVLSILSDR